jgi:hypothetical protein
MYFSVFVSDMPIVVGLKDQIVHVRVDGPFDFSDRENVRSAMYTFCDAAYSVLQDKPHLLKPAPSLADSPDAPPSIVAYTENTAKSTPPQASLGSSDGASEKLNDG